MFSLPSQLFNINGQSIQSVDFEENTQAVVVKCRRDRRRKSLDPATGKACTINHYIQCRIHDLPILGYPCVIDIELAQIRNHDSIRRIEHCDFVAKGSRYTHRFCQMISGLCRHTTVKAVSQHLGIRWETVKNIDKHILSQSLPALDPTQLEDLKYIGVDGLRVPRGMIT